MSLDSHFSSLSSVVRSRASPALSHYPLTPGICRVHGLGKGSLSANLSLFCKICSLWHYLVFKKAGQRSSIFSLWIPALGGGACRRSLECFWLISVLANLLYVKRQQQQQRLQVLNAAKWLIRAGCENWSLMNSLSASVTYRTSVLYFASEREFIRHLLSFHPFHPWNKASSRLATTSKSFRVSVAVAVSCDFEVALCGVTVTAVFTVHPVRFAFAPCSEQHHRTPGIL